MIDLELAREHLKADSEYDVSDALLEQYIKQAVAACEGYCNRKVYSTAEERREDFAQALVELEAAGADYDTAFAASASAEVKKALTDDYISKLASIRHRMQGEVIDSTWEAGILMMVGHFYRNRQEVVVSQYSGATQLPAGARKLLECKLWIGDLA